MHIRRKKDNSIIKVLFSLFCFSFVFILTGCTSTDKDEVYFGTGENFTYNCEYDSNKNETTVNWDTFIVNNTIYNIRGINVEFEYYLDNTKIGQEDLYYDIAIKTGEQKDIPCYFTCEGNINIIKLISWEPHYKSLWDTYLGWFIGSIIGASLLLIVYVIYMIVEDADLDELGDLLSEAPWWVIISLLPLIGSGIYSIISAHWVPVLIILGGIVALFIGILLAHLIKYIIEEIPYIGIGFHKFGEDADYEDYDEEDEDYDEEDEEEDEEYDEEDEDDYDDNIDYVKKTNLFSKTTNINKGKNREKEKTSKITFNSIAGLEQVKKIFREKVVLPFEHPQLFEKFGKKAGGGILLYGLPGTGKTMFAEAASNEINALFIPIKCSDIKSKWYGESEQKVKSIFNRARRAQRAIIFFDEFEAIGAKRTENGDNGNNDLVPEILAEMQGVGASHNKSTIIVIAATNKPWSIDSAFMRPGRFDEKIYVPLPDYEARKKMFELQLSKLPVEDDLDYNYLAQITEGCNGADIKEVCEKLKMSAIYDSLEKKVEQKIGMDDVKKIEKSIHSSVSQEDIIQLEEFEKRKY